MALHQPGTGEVQSGKPIVSHLLLQLGHAGSEFSDDAYYRCPYSGRLFFGGIDGLLYLKKEKDKSTPDRYPDLLLRKLSLGRRQVALSDYYTDNGKALQLPAGENSFSLTFAVPDFLSANDIEYSYRLEGYDREWSPFSNANETFYTHIPTGNYILHIKYKKDSSTMNSNTIRCPSASCRPGT